MSDLDDEELKATRKRNGVEPEIKSKYTETQSEEMIARTGIKKKYMEIDYKFEKEEVIIIKDIVEYMYKMQLKIEQLDNKIKDLEYLAYGMD